ncbi:putative gustatory receptor 28b [Haematobia irritans]|uniref:putative gustatory receptor 28b n=1 Tax=Haematobia irritans TaxID=7368 RepID=UPI003F50766A
MSSIIAVQKPVWYKRVYRKLLTSNDFYKSMQAMFCCAFVNGITPLRIVTLANGVKTLRTSIFGYCNLLMHLVLMAYCYSYTMYHHESVVGYLLRTKVSDYGNKLHVCSGVLGATVLPISAIVRKSSLEKSFNIILEADQHFSRLKCNLDYTEILRYVLFVLSMVFIFDCTITVICIYCLDSLSVYPSPCLIFLVVAEVLGISVTISLYCAIVRSIQRRIHQLNVHIEKCIWTKVIEVQINARAHRCQPKIYGDFNCHKRENAV